MAELLLIGGIAGLGYILSTRQQHAAPPLVSDDEIRAQEAARMGQQSQFLSSRTEYIQSREAADAVAMFAASADPRASRVVNPDVQDSSMRPPEAPTKLELPAPPEWGGAALMPPPQPYFGGTRKQLTDEAPRHSLTKDGHDPHRFKKREAEAFTNLIPDTVSTFSLDPTDAERSRMAASASMYKQGEVPFRQSMPDAPLPELHARQGLYKTVDELRTTPRVSFASRPGPASAAVSGPGAGPGQSRQSRGSIAGEAAVQPPIGPTQARGVDVRPDAEARSSRLVPSGQHGPVGVAVPSAPFRSSYVEGTRGASTSFPSGGLRGAPRQPMGSSLPRAPKFDGGAVPPQGLPRAQNTAATCRSTRVADTQRGQRADYLGVADPGHFHTHSLDSGYPGATRHTVREDTGDIPYTAGQVRTMQTAGSLGAGFAGRDGDRSSAMATQLRNAAGSTRGQHMVAAGTRTTGMRGAGDVAGLGPAAAGDRGRGVGAPTASYKLPPQPAGQGYVPGAGPASGTHAPRLGGESVALAARPSAEHVGQPTGAARASLTVPGSMRMVSQHTDAVPRAAAGMRSLSTNARVPAAATRAAMDTAPDFRLQVPLSKSADRQQALTRLHQPVTGADRLDAAALVRTKRGQRVDTKPSH